MQISIKNYSFRHYAEVLKLFLELQAHEHQYDPNKSINQQNIDQYVAELMKEIKNKNGEMILALVNEKCVGLISWYLESEPEFNKPYAYISDLVVMQQLRGKRIGQRLLNQALKNIRNTSAVIIHIGCLLDNVGAKAFYEKNGFKNYCVEMIKDLH